MHPRQLRERALARKSAGVPFTAIYRSLGISRNTVSCRLYSTPSKINYPADDRCPRCSRPARPVDQPADYAYLLGVYLGDGHLLTTGRVPLLKVARDLRHPGLIEEAGRAMPARGARRVGHQRRDGRDDVRSGWMPWPCLLPQHGPGRKHEREMAPTGWQQDVVDAFPGRFIRGLFHSDGCRVDNEVGRHGKTYRYPRHLFVNKSADIMGRCQKYLDRLGARRRMCSAVQLSVARRADVAPLDEHVGPAY